VGRTAGHDHARRTRRAVGRRPLGRPQRVRWFVGRAEPGRRNAGDHDTECERAGVAGSVAVKQPVTIRRGVRYAERERDGYPHDGAHQPGGQDPARADQVTQPAQVLQCRLDHLPRTRDRRAPYATEPTGQKTAAMEATALPASGQAAASGPAAAGQLITARTERRAATGR
jgi:hypothetical protein